MEKVGCTMPVILKDSYAILRIFDGHLRLWLNFTDAVARCTLGLQLSAGIIVERKNSPQAFLIRYHAARLFGWKRKTEEAFPTAPD